MVKTLYHWHQQGVTPLDLVKCRRQVDSKLYKGNVEGWRTIIRSEGARGLYTGGSPTFFGYSVQGALKYGWYEYFKKFYSDLAGEENAVKYKTGIYLAGSASAEFLADIGLCPLEAVKVRMQTTMPPFASGTFDGISKIVAAEGVGGLYKGIGPLWARQIPYTMMVRSGTQGGCMDHTDCCRNSPRSRLLSKWSTSPSPSPKTSIPKPRRPELLSQVVTWLVSSAQSFLTLQMSWSASWMPTRRPESLVVRPWEGSTRRLDSVDSGVVCLFGEWCSRFLDVVEKRCLRNHSIVMIGTLTGLQWMIYDTFKLFMGLPTTGGGGHKEEKK